MGVNAARVRLLAPALLAACLVALLVPDSGRVGSAAPRFGATVSVEGLMPPFHPDERRYVARCTDDTPIRFGAGGKATVRVGSRAVGREGLRFKPGVVPGDDFGFRVVEGDRSRAYRVRCLPADFPRWRFDAIRPIADGLFVVSLKPSLQAPQWIVVFDTQGVPRWWYRRGARVLWAQILRDGDVSWARSFGDGYGLRPQMAHEVRTTSGRLLRLVRTKGSIIDGREFREVGGGRVLVDTYVPHPADLSRVGGPRRAEIVTAGIQELDRDGRVLWRWNSAGKVRLGETRLRWWARVLGNPRPRAAGVETLGPGHPHPTQTREG